MLRRRDVERYAIGIGVFALGARAFADVLDLAGVGAAAFLDFGDRLIEVLDEKAHVMQALLGV